MRQYITFLHCKIKHRKKIPKIVQEKLPPNFRKRILNFQKKNSELLEKNSELSEKNSELSEKNSELSEWNSELTEKKCKVWVAIFLAWFSEFSSDVLFYSVSSLSSEGGGANNLFNWTKMAAGYKPRIVTIYLLVKKVIF